MKFLNFSVFEFLILWIKKIFILNIVVKYTYNSPFKPFLSVQFHIMKYIHLVL